MNVRAVFAFPGEAPFPSLASARLPVIVPPTAEKRYRDLYRLMYSDAHLDIDVADRILILGYSFPTIDVAATRWLGDALRGRRERPIANARLVPASSQPEDEQRVLIATGFAADGFKNACWELSDFDDAIL